eukprot:TRINITY_DN8595_c0_g1_i1.p1 TRINITY_DN8595_c0_g1~~TRINITY_DN8595_c0_g1_i1.p1  ORF type:complete len:466 (+),score=75.61 TRINITY_DN8595_c0_g1_i1:1157-2554(+)
MKVYHRAYRFVSRMGWKHWLAILAVSMYLLDYFGIFLKLKSRSYRREYTYPLEGRILSYVDEMKRGDKPSMRPIYSHNYRILKNPKHKCLDEDGAQYVPLRLIYIVKSAVEHFEQRKIIRKSWGYEKRFADVPIRTVFLLGLTDDIHFQAQIENEHMEYQDLIQGNFMDRYYNNSIKTAMGIRWAAEQCARARFYMFVDDDYYVSTKNMLRFLRNPVGYPKYLEEDVISFDEDTMQLPRKRHRRSDQVREENAAYNDYLDFQKIAYDTLNESDVIIKSDNGTEISDDNVDKSDDFDSKKSVRNLTSSGDVIKKENLTDDVVFKSRKLNQLVDFDLPEDVRLFAGQVFPDSSPMRHRSSKWFVTLDEYPFDRYPPFITAGAYVLSRAALIDMYYTSYFTKLFRFDDIWLGMIAKKADIEPFHSSEFYLWRKPYTVRSYRYVVASHGFENGEELFKVWEEQKMAGNA